MICEESLIQSRSNTCIHSSIAICISSIKYLFAQKRSSYANLQVWRTGEGESLPKLHRMDGGVAGIHTDWPCLKG